MLLAITATALASVAAVYAEVLSAVDTSHRLRSERLLLRQGPETGVAQWLTKQSVWVSRHCLDA